VTQLDKWIDRDLQILDLVHLLPGASIGDLAKMSGDSHGVTLSHIRNLMQVRLVAVYSEYVGGHSVRRVYPCSES
jgi:hypothetical protein